MGFTLHYRPRHLERINRQLEAISGPGSGRFADACEAALKRGNRDDRLRGVDRRGRPLVPLKSGRKGRYAGAKGPPLAPFGEASRSISQFFVRVTRRRAGWTMTAGFSGEGAEILGFHATGSGPNPVRDVFGVSPATHATLRKLFREFAAGAFRPRGLLGRAGDALFNLVRR